MQATRTIPLLDLKAQHRRIRAEIMEAIARVVDSQQFILGEEVARLEEEIALYSSAAHAVGCASGTDALYLALMALGAGPGDEVVTTPYSFFATASTIVRLGARPVFVDIDELTFNIDPALAVEALRMHPRVKAIVPVHLFGACADMDPLIEAAAARGIPVIEDAAQAIGAEYKGRRAGSLTRVGCFSFFPTKNLGAYGDAGILTTSDAALAERLAILRVHGGKTKYHHDVVGINSRLDALQAAVLRVKLRHLDEWTAARQRNAALYRELLPPQVVAQVQPAFATRHIYHQFVIHCRRRDKLRRFLAERGIGTEIYYPVPLHMQPCFAVLGYGRGDFPAAERLAEESLALPIHSELAPDDIRYVCAAITEFAGQIE
jgi:dTDP-4-amino-4,6-dideoxygalactose transaminase